MFAHIVGVVVMLVGVAFVLAGIAGDGEASLPGGMKVKGSSGLVVIGIGAAIFLSGNLLSRKPTEVTSSKAPQEKIDKCQLPPPELDKESAARLNPEEQFELKRLRLTQNCIFRQPADGYCSQEESLLRELSIYGPKASDTPAERMETASHNLTVAIESLTRAKAGGCLID